MMKNIEQTTLLCIAILCAGLMIGILIGRFGTNQAVQISAYDQTAAEQPEQTLPYRSETAGKININLATAEELSMLPGIGMTYAKRIVEYRTKYGPFLSLADLEKVKGIGESRIQAIKEYVTLGG